MSLITNILIDNTILFTINVIKSATYLIYYGGSYLYNRRYYNNQEKKINELHDEIIELNKRITELKEHHEIDFEIIEKN
jgi:hypothetical protein